MSQTRLELESIRDQIDILNQRKTPWVRAWEKEKECDPGALKPPEIRSLNSQLHFLYEQRDAILKDHPELEDEFGGTARKKKPEHSGPPMKTKAQITSEDRAKRKKKIHPEFKGWCAAQKPPIKFSLEHWEDAAICDRFKAWLGVEKLREHEGAERQAAEASARAEEDRRRQDEIKKKYEAIPRAFKDFLASESSGASLNHEAVILAWEDADTLGLYELWTEERREKQATA